MVDEKFRETLIKLLEKSRQDKVRWTDDRNGYSVQFAPHRSILVEYISPPARSDVVSATLINNEQVAVSLIAEDGEPDFDMLRDLHEEARRCVVGWDVALESLEKALESNETIGQPF